MSNLPENVRKTPISNRRHPIFGISPTRKNKNELRNWRASIPNITNLMKKGEGVFKPKIDKVPVDSAVKRSETPNSARKLNEYNLNAAIVPNANASNLPNPNASIVSNPNASNKPNPFNPFNVAKTLAFGGYSRKSARKSARKSQRKSRRKSRRRY